MQIRVRRRSEELQNLQRGCLVCPRTHRTKWSIDCLPKALGRSTWKNECQHHFGTALRTYQQHVPCRLVQELQKKFNLRRKAKAFQSCRHPDGSGRSWCGVASDFGEDEDTCDWMAVMRHAYSRVAFILTDTVGISD